MLVLALSCPATVKEKFLTCWTAGPELLPAFFRSPVILGIPAMALNLKTNDMKEGWRGGNMDLNISLVYLCGLHFVHQCLAIC